MIILDSESQKEALKIARYSIEQFLNLNQIPKVVTKNQNLYQKLGIFTTLRSKDRKLRGCIGVFESIKPLYLTIRDISISSATQDSRFDQITSKEIKNIIIELSILTTPKEVSWRQVIPGMHGVLIKRGSNSATFLPEVASENNWNLMELLEHLCLEKAGLEKDCYLDPHTRLFIYESQKISESS